MTYQIVLTTCPDQESAERLANHLVEQGLAACVNVIPGLRSVYRWKGEVVKDSEWLLVIKSRADRFGPLEKTIIQNHPYELPEVVAVSVSDAHRPYLAWIDRQLDNPQ